MEQVSEKKSLKYSWYVVFILMLAYVSSFIDRQILSLLVGPLKRDFQLSDTQVSLLMGISFALFYTILGIPIGRLADRYNRRNIIMIGIAVWSLMTAITGSARSYTQLFLARIGVGVGEAALSPAAFSILTDYFPKNKLATALSVYNMGIYIGSGCAVLIGSILVALTKETQLVTIPFVGEIFSWQLIFFYIGIPPGIMIVLLLFTVDEPIRTGLIAKSDGKEGAHRVSLSEALIYINKKRVAFLSVTLGFTFISMVGYGSTAWIPTYFVRTFGWKAQEAGLIYGIIITIFSTSGALSGGFLADWFTKKGYTDGKLRVGIISATTILLFSSFILVPDPYIVLVLLVIPCFFTAFPAGASAAAVQELMPNQVRALASSIYFFIINMIALGLGPTSVALLTDYVFQDEKALKYSLMSVTIFGSLSALICFSYGLAAYRKAVKE